MKNRCQKAPAKRNKDGGRIGEFLVSFSFGLFNFTDNRSMFKIEFKFYLNFFTERKNYCIVQLFAKIQCTEARK